MGRPTRPKVLLQVQTVDIESFQLRGGVSQDAFGALIPFDDFPVQIDLIDGAVRYAIQEKTQLTFALLQRLLRVPLFGDVAHDGGEADLAGAVAPLGERQMQRESRSVLAFPFDIAANSDDMRDIGPDIAVHMAIMRLALVVGHQYADALSHHVVRAIAEDLFGGAVER